MSTPHDHGGNSSPPYFKAIGIVLAVTSGLLNGLSAVVKKRGLLMANEKYHEIAGEGYGYLRTARWWLGMTLEILSELCNFIAYAFVDAILVTPLGALSVVVAAVLSAMLLKEKLSFVGKVGCFNCVVGSVIIAVNAPGESSVKDIQEMKYYVVSPGFLSYAGVVSLGCAIAALWLGPRYGKRTMFVYLGICSLIGGLNVVAIQGIGSAIIAQIRGEAQFNQWFLYVVLVFAICTLLTQIVYHNKALNVFNTAQVSSAYYVTFTAATLVASLVLYRGFRGATTMEIITVVLAFLHICAGVILLQGRKATKPRSTEKLSGSNDSNGGEQRYHALINPDQPQHDDGSADQDFSPLKGSREKIESLDVENQRDWNKSPRSNASAFLHPSANSRLAMVPEEDVAGIRGQVRSPSIYSRNTGSLRSHIHTPLMHRSQSTERPLWGHLQAPLQNLSLGTASSRSQTSIHTPTHQEKQARKTGPPEEIQGLVTGNPFDDDHENLDVPPPFVDNENMNNYDEDEDDGFPDKHKLERTTSGAHYRRHNQTLSNERRISSSDDRANPTEMKEAYTYLLPQNDESTSRGIGNSPPPISVSGAATPAASQLDFNPPKRPISIRLIPREP